MRSSGLLPKLWVLIRKERMLMVISLTVGELIALVSLVGGAAYRIGHDMAR